MPEGTCRAHVAVGPDVELADGRAGLVHSGKGKGHHTDLEIKRKGYYRLGNNIQRKPLNVITDNVIIWLMLSE